MAMPTTLRQSSFDSESDSRSGISARYGGHQVAQKLSKVGRTRNESSATGFPSRSGRTNAGAALPGGFAAARSSGTAERKYTSTAPPARGKSSSPARFSARGLRTPCGRLPLARLEWSVDRRLEEVVRVVGDSLHRDGQHYVEDVLLGESGGEEGLDVLQVRPPALLDHRAGELAQRAEPRIGNPGSGPDGVGD